MSMISLLFQSSNNVNVTVNPISRLLLISINIDIRSKQTKIRKEVGIDYLHKKPVRNMPKLCRV